MWPGQHPDLKRKRFSLCVWGYEQRVVRIFLSLSLSLPSDLGILSGKDLFRRRGRGCGQKQKTTTPLAPKAAIAFCRFSEASS